MNRQPNNYGNSHRVNIPDYEDEEPLCCFGPGGTYVSFWPLSQEKTKGVLSAGIRGVLEMLGVLMGVCPSDVPQRTLDTSLHQWKEPMHDTQCSATGASDTASTSDIGGHLRFPAEPMLFSDDSRVSRRTQPKPKYRVRTYRRTPRKRASLDSPGQGTLFEVDVPRAKTA